jgi:predicted house-cleaning noncanonical NTP pyrophosphatase (MazG superfamily)
LPEKQYNKLVRDNIPTIIRKQGKEPITDIITNEKEFEEYLGRKLIEESKEFYETKEVEELLDIMEVFYSILKYKGIDFSDFEKMRLTKRRERGGFDKRILLQKVVG